MISVKHVAVEVQGHPRQWTWFGVCAGVSDHVALPVRLVFASRMATLTPWAFYYGTETNQHVVKDEAEGFLSVRRVLG